MRKLVQLGVLAIALALLTATTAVAALPSGSSGAFSFVATMGNTVNVTGNGIHLKTKDHIKVKTTFSSQPSTWAGSGWHYHRGPNIVSVTQGTLTFWRADCTSFEVPDPDGNAGYIESTGEVLLAKNLGSTTAEWFTTRLYPDDGVDDLVPVVHADCQ